MPSFTFLDASMKMPFRCLVTTAFLFLVSSQAHAAIIPGLFMNAEGLFYQSKEGVHLKLVSNDPELYKVLKQKSSPISATVLRQIPVGTPTINIFEKDTDQDGLDDEYERAFGTNLQKKDTDQDGFQDAQEISQGYDPLQKSKKLVLNRSTYLKYQGQFVWESKTKQVWYVSSSASKRFFITSRPKLATRYLQELATKQQETPSPSTPSSSSACLEPVQYLFNNNRRNANVTI